MKSIVFIAYFLVFACLPLRSQIQDFKVKNSANQVQRTQMLDLLRGEIRKTIRQEVVFVVDHFKVSGEYSWFEGSVQRKDGGQITFPDEDYECCKTTCLFVKRVSNSMPPILVRTGHLGGLALTNFQGDLGLGHSPK